MAEAATIGNEGMTGIALAMGQRVPLGSVIAQLPGEVSRVDINFMQKLVDEVPGVRLMIQRFGLAFMHQLSQSTGCNQFHSIKQRCARWLLTMYERAPMLPGMIPSSPARARTAPLRVTRTSSP